MRWLALALLLAGCVQAPPPKPRIRPTQTGDFVGTATMAQDRSILLKLITYGCDGFVGHGDMVVLPSEPRHAEVIDHISGIEPGETKVVRAWPTPPCPPESPRERRRRQ